MTGSSLRAGCLGCHHHREAEIGFLVTLKIAARIEVVVRGQQVCQDSQQLVIAGSSLKRIWRKSLFRFLSSSLFFSYPFVLSSGVLSS